MKKLFFTFFVVFSCFAYYNEAFAVVSAKIGYYINNTTTIDCIDNSTSTDSSNWSVKCRNSGSNYITIDGVAVCSSTAGATEFSSTATSLSATKGDRLYCWCKMVSPAVSKWIYIFTWANGSTPYEPNCTTNCSRFCAYYIDSYSKNLFKNLIND